VSPLSRYVLSFVAGMACGGFLVSVNKSGVPTTVSDALPPEEVATVALGQTDLEGSTYHANGSPPSDRGAASLDVSIPAPVIPGSYRDTIGPIVAHKSYGEQYRDFEAEPIDGSWAQAMEIGINDFIAIHGPSSNEVFEFVQCRSSNCVLAGYKDPSQEPQGASIIGDLSRQPWWQGGGSASSTNTIKDGRRSFVIFISRYDRQGKQDE
jgi:hypothetical protein